MKKLTIILLSTFTFGCDNAHGQGWVVPGLIGGIVGYSLAQPRYYYGPYGYTVPPTVYVQPPVVVQQQPPVYVQPNQVCEQKTFQDTDGNLRSGTFCYQR
jgi:hypothetical protein